MIPSPPELIRALARAARDFPLREKLLLAPSYRVGGEWIDGAARLAGGVANIRLVTPKRLLLDLAESDLRRRGLRVPAPEETLAMAGRLFSPPRAAARKGEEAGYFTRLPASFSLVEAIARALDDVDGAGLRGLGRTARHFASREKYDELSRFHRSYRSARERAGCAGGAELLECALAGLRRRSEDGGGAPLLLLPESVGEDADAQFLALLDAWPPDRLLPLGEDAAETDAAEPGPRVRTAPADSVANEARQVFRTLFREGVPLDNAEIIVTDARTYIPALCEAGMEAFRCPPDELPLTFHAGLPVASSRPARLLSAWAQWVGGGLPPAGLARMIRDGLAGGDPRGEAPGIPPEELAARVLRLPVHGLPAEYARALRRGRADGDDGARRAEQWLARQLRAILPLAPDGETLLPESPVPVLRAARSALRLAGGAASRFDAYAAAALEAAIDAWIPHCDWPGFKPLPWLERLVDSLRVMGLGPQPGRAHVTDIAGGGFSGRTRTFVIGLDDARFPGAQRQDPVLLDRERLRLSPALPLSGRARERRERAMRRLLARLRGDATLSYARQDGEGGGEGGDNAPALLFTRFAENAPPAPPAVLRPAAEEEAVTGRDALLWTVLPAARNALSPADFAPRFPGLARGREAREARLRGDASPYNGLVPEAGAAYRAAPWPVSPTDLETLAANPAEYFFRRVLGIAPPDRFTPAPGKWLEGNERGTLLHDLFQDFVAGLINAGDDALSDPAGGGERLLDMLERALARYRRDKPVRDELAYERERGILIQACVIFLDAERERLSRGRPLVLEAALGGAAADRPPWERTEPIALSLPSGGVLRLRGRIDRIDRLHNHGGLAVLDYKTGRSDAFSAADPFQEGRHLQPLLYCFMLEAALREAGLPEPVREFAYFFPMPRDEGRVIRYAREQLADGGGGILDALHDRLAKGVYPVAASAKAYAYSEYLPLFQHPACFPV